MDRSRIPSLAYGRAGRLQAFTVGARAATETPHPSRGSRMLSYAFTEEQEDLREMVREFAQGEILPLVEEAEREEKFPVQILPMLGELGLLGIVFPEEYGGIGADKITECIFVE